jgi:hypothetical protein
MLYLGMGFWNDNLRRSESPEVDPYSGAHFGNSVIESSSTFPTSHPQDVVMPLVNPDPTALGDSRHASPQFDVVSALLSESH